MVEVAVAGSLRTGILNLNCLFISFQRVQSSLTYICTVYMITVRLFPSSSLLVLLTSQFTYEYSLHTVYRAQEDK
jgi:hypothetical protein